MRDYNSHWTKKDLEPPKPMDQTLIFALGIIYGWLCIGAAMWAIKIIEG